MKSKPTGKGGKGPAGRGGGKARRRQRQRPRLTAANVAELLVLLLLLGVPLVVVPTAREAFRLPKLLLAEGLALLSLLPLVWGLRRWRPSWGRLTAEPVLRLTLPLVLAAGLSVAFTAYPLHSREALFDLLVGAAALVAWSLGLAPARLRRLLTGSLLPASVLAAVAVLQFHDLFRPFQFASGEETRRLGVTSLAGNPGDLAGLLVIAALIAQGTLMGSGRRRRWLVGGALLLCLYGLAVSQTVAAIAALLLGSLVFWGRLLPRRWLGVMAAAAAVGVLLAALVVAPLRGRAASLGERAVAGRLNALVSGRLDGWRAAVAMGVGEPLTGVGQGAYEPAYGPTKLSLVDAGVEMYRGQTAMFANAHNDPLEVWAEWGAVGLLALAFALWLLWRQLRRLPAAPEEESWGGAVSSRRLELDQALAWGLVTALGVLAVGHFPFRLAITGYPALLVLAWIFAWGRLPSAAADSAAGARDDAGGRRSAGPALVVPLLAVVVLALVVHGYRAHHRLRASRALHAVEVVTQGLATSGQLPSTVLWRHVRLLEEAQRLNPADAAIPVARGSQYLLMRRPEEAAAAYREALALEVRPESYLNLGRALAMAGDDAAAQDSFLNAVKLDPNLLSQVPERFRDALPRRRELFGIDDRDR